MMSRLWLIVAFLGLGCRPPSAPPKPIAPTSAIMPASEVAAAPELNLAPVTLAEVPSSVPTTVVEPPEPMARPARSLDELLLFQPTRLDADTAAPRPFAKIWIVADDGVGLSAWYASPANPKGTVLFLHGNGGNLFSSHRVSDWLVREANCTVLAVDYRGYGQSEGESTVEGVLCDARAARRELEQRAGVSAAEVILMGHSLGGALAVQLAAESPPRALVLQSTFSSLADAAAVHFGKLSALIPDGRLDSIAALSRYNGLVFQSHGDADSVIPFALGEKLHAAATGPKRFLCLPGADHNRVLTPEYLRELQNFLHELR